MTAKAGTSMSSVVDPQRLPDTRPHGSNIGLRVQVVWWLEWVDANGQRCLGPEHGFVQSQGTDADRPRFAAAAMLIGRTRYGIRHGHEVVIALQRVAQSAWHKRAAMLGHIQADFARVKVSRLYIEGRPIVGQELRAILDSVIAARTSKAEASRQRVARLDTALPNIRAEEREPETPFWLDPVEDQVSP